MLASLNHPNIAAIYGLEEQADVGSGFSRTIQALVLELVEGPTLADVLAGRSDDRPLHSDDGRGRFSGRPLPLDEALPIARQIADALEAAHECGVIHRDLKPANVKVRPDGTVKVLDFGLAKLNDPNVPNVPNGPNDPNVPNGPNDPNALTASPTMTSPAMTQMGVILGTAAYMSPEQARGRDVDKRADIWAFGCVLYEMLTGRAAFPGADISEVLAGVIKSEVAWTALPANTPAKVRALLRRCLQKDPKQRLRDVGDARLEIEEALAAPEADARAAPTIHAGGARERLAWSVAATAIVLALVVGVMAFWWKGSEPATRVFRSLLLPPTGASLADLPHQRLALSPDGRRLAWSAGTGGNLTQLWVQPLDGFVAQPLPGTEGALTPFWSPDGRFVGFYAGGVLKTIDTAGGSPLTVAQVGAGNPGATWNRDNVILFSGTGDGSVIRRVPAAGGPVSQVTTLDRDNGEAQHWAPFFLPDGRHFLYVALGTKSGGPAAVNGIYVGALDSTERKLLVPGGASPRYAQGYLLFLRDQTLMAQPFDVDRLEFTGDPVPLAEQVATGGLSGRMGAVTLSETDVLAYHSGAGGDVSQLVWLNRAGQQIGTVGDRGDYGDLELSADGQRAAVSFADASANYDIWLFDLERGLRTRLTFDPASDLFPIWSRDGIRIVFSSNRKGSADLYEKPSSGLGSEDVLQGEPDNESPFSWSHDGRSILYGRTSGTGTLDLWVLPLTGDRKPFPFMQTPFAEAVGVFSPDGRWAAYVSNESGRNEVYVAPFPVPQGKWQISTAGGNWPRWRRDGRELFYLAPDNRLMATEVNGAGSSFEVGTVRPLFQTQARINRRYMYEVSPDGQRFLINTRVEQAVQPITLLVNWPGALRK